MTKIKWYYWIPVYGSIILENLSGDLDEEDAKKLDTLEMYHLISGLIILVSVFIWILTL